MAPFNQGQEAQSPRRLDVAIGGQAIQATTGVVGMPRRLSQGEDGREASIRALQFPSPMAA
jgi:hypothetical protein